MDDRSFLSTARQHITHGKLGVHVIPGFATIDDDIKPAIDLGVDVFRVACHCTEADTTQRHISFARTSGKEVYGALMMSHMADAKTLAEEAFKMQEYGADGVVLYDSAGAQLPEEVAEKVTALAANLHIPVGYHAHNNLGMAVANSVAAVRAGASILDGTARGFGAGAGNTQLEVLVAVLHRLGFETGVDLFKLLEAADLAERELIREPPRITGESVVSGMAGVFSGFIKHVKRISEHYGVDAREVLMELGRRKVVAGQEDLIIEVAQELAKGVKRKGPDHAGGGGATS